MTQPQAWKALRTELGDEAESRIVKRVRNLIEKKGTLHALRKGVDESGSHYDLCFFHHPAVTMRNWKSQLSAGLPPDD